MLHASEPSQVLTPTGKALNIVSGILFLTLTALEGSRSLRGLPWNGISKIAHLVDFVLIPLWLAAALVLIFNRRANEHYIFLWGMALVTLAHGLFLIIAGNTVGLAFLAGLILMSILQGLRIHFSGTSAIEKMYPRSPAVRPGLNRAEDFRGRESSRQLPGVK